MIYLRVMNADCVNLIALLCYHHKLKFCEKHFTAAIRYYRQYMWNIPEDEPFYVMTPVLESLAKAIEKYHGKNLPDGFHQRDFRHASENYGTAISDVILTYLHKLP